MGKMMVSFECDADLAAMLLALRDLTVCDIATERAVRGVDEILYHLMANADGLALAAGRIDDVPNVKFFCEWAQSASEGVTGG